MKKINSLVYILIFLSLTLAACHTQQLTTTEATATKSEKTPKATITTPPAENSSKEADERGFIVKIGDVVPDFAMTLTDGTTTSLKELQAQHKVIMLQFTASWCGVCRKEMPHIESEVWQPYKDKGLMVVGVDRDEPLEKVLKFKEQTKVTYPLALDPNADIFARFANKNQGVTRNIIIDQAGNIAFLTRLFKRDEFDEMKEVIKQLLES